MTEFQSDCPDLWFVSDTRTPFVANRIENGNAHVKDLIANEWKKPCLPHPAQQVQEHRRHLA